MNNGTRVFLSLASKSNNLELYEAEKSSTLTLVYNKIKLYHFSLLRNEHDNSFLSK